jgi:hypothetical protein
MAAAVTTLREAVTQKLQDDLGIQFVAGKFDGPAAQDIGCVYVSHSEPNRRDINLRDDTLVVRIFRPYIQRDPTVEMPLDPAPLEDLELAVLDSLQPVQDDQTYLPGFFEWLSTEFEHDLQGIEMQFRSWRRSEYAKGG